MFNRNGIVIRTAYPQGFHDETADVCHTLRLFLHGLCGKWMASLKAFFFGEASRMKMLNGIYVVITVVWSIACLVANGTVCRVKNENGVEKSTIYHTPFYSIKGVRPLPVIWSILFSVIVALFMCMPLILYSEGLWGGRYRLAESLYSAAVAFFFPYIIWNVLKIDRARNLINRKIKECAPVIHKELRLPISVAHTKEDAGEMLRLLKLSVAGKLKKTCFQVRVTG